MNAVPDSRKIAAAFHQQASEYDQNIAVQKRVVANLIRQIRAGAGGVPGRILDVGSGTGSLLTRLHTIYPAAALCGVDLAYNMCQRTYEKLGQGALVVNAAAENLPFADGTFDLVVSTSALQWVADLERALHEMRRVLKPGGKLEVAFFCEGTLGELQRCFSETLAARGQEQSWQGARLHRFQSVADLKNILAGMDFEKIVLTCESETDWYDDLHSLLRSIRSIGAGTVAGGSGGGLGWRGILNEASRLYREYYGQNESIPVTYKVLYLQAQLSTS